jgi:hypothetical protein
LLRGHTLCYRSQERCGMDSPEGEKAPVMIYGTPDKQSSSIRVLLANVPIPLAEWLARVLEDQKDIEIVDQPRGYVEMLLAAQKGVDVVVLSVQEFQPLPGICSHLLSEFPDIKVLLLGMASEKAMLCWTGLRQKDLQIVSAEALVGTLRHLGEITETA